MCASLSVKVALPAYQILNQARPNVLPVLEFMFLFIVVPNLFHIFVFVLVRAMMGELFPSLESELDAFLTYAEKQDGM